MGNLCGLCNVCSFMPKQRYERTLSIEGDEENPPLVLVIDDAPTPKHYGDSISMMHHLMGEGIDFTYTNSIRCEHKPRVMNDDQFKEAISKCAVWTHSLVGGRSVIITTLRGLVQLKIEEGHAPGDMFRSSKYGVVLVIPRILEIEGTVEELFKRKVQRVLKEAKII